MRVKDGRPIDSQQLIHHCHTLIAGYKCPRSVEIRAQPFPMSGAGKILKNELRQPYWAGTTRQVN